MSGVINCRARLSPACENGKAWTGVDRDPAGDGTWNGRSIVCNHCYVMLIEVSPSGSATLDEIPWCIAVVRDMQKPLKERADKFTGEVIAAGLTPTAVPDGDSAYVCTALSRDGRVLTRVRIEEGKPPMEIKESE